MFRRALQDSKEDLAQRFFSMLVYWKDKGWFRDSTLGKVSIYSLKRYPQHKIPTTLC